MPAPAVEHQDEQAGLVVLFLRELMRLWPLLDLQRLASTKPTWTAAAAGLASRYGAASASLAADYYDAERVAAGVGGRFAVSPAEPAGLDQVTASLDWATKGLWSTDPDADAARRLVGSVGQKLILDPSRATLLDAIAQDGQARGWARVARPGACWFCRMLATRGAVYKTEATALFRADGRRYHDDCHCNVEPLFGLAHEPPAHVRQWQAMWRDATAGKSGRAARIAFRQAVEGR